MDAGSYKTNISGRQKTENICLRNLTSNTCILVTDLVELDLSKDGDVCSIEELNGFYQHPYHPASRKAIGLEKLFILHLDCQWNTNKLAAALSNNSVHLSNCDTLEKLTTFVAHDQNIIDIHFSPSDPNCLITASSNGSVRVWDVRNTQKYSLELKGKEHSKLSVPA